MGEVLSFGRDTYLRLGGDNSRSKIAALPTQPFAGEVGPGPCSLNDGFWTKFSAAIAVNAKVVSRE